MNYNNVNNFSKIIPTNDIPKNFTDLSNLWLNSKKAKLKLSTFSKYQYLLKDYILPEIGFLLLSQLDTKVLDFAMERIYYKNEKEHLSNSLMKCILYIINAILKYGARGKYNNAVLAEFELPRNDMEEIITLTSEQETRLITHILSKKSDNNLGILISLYTGIRIGEVCSLQRKDVDFENSVLHIRKTVQRLKLENSNKTELIVSTPKSRKSYRVIPMPQFLCDIVKEYGIIDLHADTYILGKKKIPYEPRTLQYGFKRLLKDCNVKYMNFHCLRHTFATNCVKSGFDVKTLSEVLGHSNVNFTMNRYVHSDLERKREQMELLNTGWQQIIRIS